MLRLIIKIKNNRLLYRISPFSRIPFALIAAFLLWGVLSLNGGLSTVSIIIFLISIAGLSYRETWIFDNEKKTVSSIWGFMFFVKRMVFKYEDISHLQITHFVKGRMGNTEKETKANKKGRKSMLVFSLILKNSDKHDLEILPESKSGGKTETNAQEITSFCGLALNVDRPRDMGTNYNIHDISGSPFSS